MIEARYRVIFAGDLTGEYDADTAQSRFAKLFGISQTKAARFFTGEPRILKSDLSEAAAMEYMFRVAEAGCECAIEEMVEGPPEGIDERRHGGDRRHRFRRGPRPGAILPDRRLKIRRVEDRRHYLRLHEKGSELPLPLAAYPVAAAIV